MRRAMSSNTALKGMAVFLALLLAWVATLPISNAYGNYYQNQFNDSTTSKNLSFPLGYNMTWFDIQRRVNMEHDIHTQPDAD
jgi:hypothetical protein